MSTVEVHVAGEREQQAVIDVITLAFSTDPMARWAFPHPQTYLAIMPEAIKAFGGNGFAHGTVHLADGGGAAAMWLPPGVQPDSDRLEALTAQHAPPEQQADMTQVFEQMGMDPTSQGRGYGSALLRHALELVDRTGAPAYLESSNPRNVPLYERHGFEVIGSIQAGSSPTVVPMLRRPR
jgi:GNAT superfamily N-acetyltransferase